MPPIAARVLRVAALVTLAFSFCLALPPAVTTAVARIGRGAAAGDLDSTRRRALGDAWVDDVARLRQAIPSDGTYALVAAVAASEASWLRYELAPRRARYLGTIAEVSRSDPQALARGGLVVARRPDPDPPAPDRRSGPTRGSAAAEKLAQLAAILLFALPGLALAALLPVGEPDGAARADRGGDAITRLAIGYLLGVAWMAGALFAASLLMGLPLRRPAVLGLASLPLLVWTIRACSSIGARRAAGLASPAADVAATREARAAVDRLPLLAWALVALVTLGTLLAPWGAPLLDWDGRQTWVPLARYLRADATVTPRALREPGWDVSHPGYPPLLPLAQVAAQEATGAVIDSEAFRGLYAAFLPVWLLLVHGLARRASGGRATALTVAAAALLPLPALEFAGGAASAYSDLPLACFLAGALWLLLDARGSAARALAAGTLLGAAVLAKNEGLPLAIWTMVVVVAARAPLAGGAAAAAASPRWRWPTATALVAPVLAAVALLVLWRDACAITGAEETRAALAAAAGDPSRLLEVPLGAASLAHALGWGWRTLPAIPARLPGLLSEVRIRTIQLEDWGYFWSAALLVGVAGWRGLARRRALGSTLALVALAPLALGFGACLLAANPADLARMIWNRVLLVAAAPLLALFAMTLDELLAGDRRPPVR